MGLPLEHHQLRICFVLTNVLHHHRGCQRYNPIRPSQRQAQPDQDYPLLGHDLFKHHLTLIEKKSSLHHVSSLANINSAIRKRNATHNQMTDRR